MAAGFFAVHIFSVGNFCKGRIKRKLQKVNRIIMYRLLFLISVMVVFISCSKDHRPAPAPTPIPDEITGEVRDFTLTPIDLNTPDKGVLFISTIDSRYKVQFNAADGPAANARMSFKTDTILTDQSREYTNLGIDAVAYNPVADNQISIIFNDGREVNGIVDLATNFGGVFGQSVISQWRDPNDPSRPTQKAKDDFMNLIRRYDDKDGPGPGSVPQFLVVTITRE